MMVIRIATVPEKNDLPVVPGAVFVIAQGGGMFSAHGPVAPGPPGAVNKNCHPTIAILERIAAGVYRVWSDNAAILAGGKTQAEYLLTDRAKLKVWEVTGTVLDPISQKQVTVTRTVTLETVPAADPTVTKPWTVNGITVTSAKPTCSTVFAGLEEMRADIDKAVAVTP